MPGYEDDDLWKMSVRIERVFDDLLGGQQRMMRFGERGWAPAIDVYETAESLVILVELAGACARDVQIVLHQNALKISGFRDYPRGDRRQKLHQMEIDFGRFERVIRLPVHVSEDQVSASFKDGFLTILVSKEKRRERRTIEIEGD